MEENRFFVIHSRASLSHIDQAIYDIKSIKNKELEKILKRLENLKSIMTTLIDSKKLSKLTPETISSFLNFLSALRFIQQNSENPLYLEKLNKKITETLTSLNTQSTETHRL